MDSGGGMVRGQGPMPHLKHLAAGIHKLQERKVFRMNQEAFDLSDLDEDLAHQSSRAGVPPVDPLSPVGGEGHRGKGQGGHDQGGRYGDVFRSQGPRPLRQDPGEREGKVPERRQRSLDLLGDVLRVSHGNDGDDATLQ